jgi:broad specificity phosphatase PhoE
VGHLERWVSSHQGFTHPFLIIFELSCPGGESAEDMCARVDNVVAKVGTRLDHYISLISGRFESIIDSTSKRARERATY